MLTLSVNNIKALWASVAAQAVEWHSLWRLGLELKSSGSWELFSKKNIQSICFLELHPIFEKYNFEANFSIQMWFKAS